MQPAHGLVALLGAAGHEILVDLGKRDAARLHRRHQRVDVLLVELLQPFAGEAVVEVFGLIGAAQIR